MSDTVPCSCCGRPFHYPAALRTADRQFAAAIGGQAGETCDDCTEVIINGGPDELLRLLARKGEGAP